MADDFLAPRASKQSSRHSLNALLASPRKDPDWPERPPPWIRTADDSGRSDNTCNSEADKVIAANRDIWLCLVRRLCNGSGVDPEDIVQNAILSILTNWHRRRVTGCYKTWCYTIILHEASHELQKEKKHQGKRVAEFDDALMSNDALSENVIENVMHEETCTDLKTAVEQLPEKYSAPLLLYACDGQSYQEIAERLGLPLNTVKSDIKRARTMLRKRLAIADGHKEF